MTLELWIFCGVILGLILMSALFSGSETALTAVSRARMHRLANRGDGRASIVENLIEKRDRLIGVMLIGNNLINILASSLMTSMLLDIFGQAGVAYATAIMTVLLVIFAEVLPKSWAISSPERNSLSLVRFAQGAVLIFGPVSDVVNWIVRKILAIFGVSLAAGTSMFSAQEELRGAVDLLHKEGSVVKGDRDQIGGLLDLRELEVYDVMIHRTDMDSVNADDPIETIITEILASHHTRIPVWRGTNDNFVGVVHAKDLVRAIRDANRDFSKINIMKVATKPWFVPDTTTLQDQLNAFLRRKAHIAIVVDEYGDVQGLITLEDILEEIVGDIADEHDIDVQGVRPQPDGSILVDGSVPIRDLNRALDWNLPDTEATTIAGFVIHQTQSIPKEKQAYTFHGKRFTIIKREKNRITRLRIRPIEGEDKPKAR
ncbi:HlyC/CorC family transporter [Phyllobacterium ifriqiyense]|uniref:HlyC/CorC family transporter n=1 Tax=Phyllobacterium ifriqiyense TaxID=314238 RepID=UPI0033997E38